MAQTGDSRGKKPKAAPDGDPAIPDKLYFRIGEVARLLNIAPYVLRFWESEFPQLHPNKGGTGQRLYRRRDVEMALRIKRLLYDEGYTILGARQLLKAEPRQKDVTLPEQKAVLPEQRAVPAEQRLRKLRSELSEIAGILARPVPGTRRVVQRPEHRVLPFTHRRAKGAPLQPDAHLSDESPPDER